MKRFLRIAARIFAAIFVLLLIAALAGVLVVRSGWFQEKVRERIVFELDRATGGRTELGQFSFDWRSLTARVESLVVHGKESAAGQPFLRAGAAEVGLRIISAVDRNVNLALVKVDRPEVMIVVYPDGTTNVPGPARRGQANWAENLLNLKVRRYEINDGVFELDQQKFPLNLSGEDLRVVMNYDSIAPAYRGEVRSRRMRANPGPGKGLWEASLEGGFILDKDGLSFPQLQIATAESSAVLSGRLNDVRAPHGTFDMKAAVSIREAVQKLRLPIGPQGSAEFNGKLTVNFGAPFTLGLAGRVAARGVGYVRERLRIENATVRADAQLSQDGLVLRQIQAAALGSTITGDAEILNWRKFHMDGSLAGLSLQRAAAIFTDRPVAWSGTLSGPFRLDQTVGGSDLVARATLMVARADGGVPVEGEIDGLYDQAAGTVGLGSSHIATPASRLDVSGTLGQTLRVQLRTSNPDDLLPAIAMVEAHPPSTLYLKLNGGSASADGSVTGPLDNPTFAGRALITNGAVEGHGFDRLAAQVEADKRGIRAERLSLVRGTMEVTGAASLAERNESLEDGALTATLTARNLDIAPLLREAGSSWPLTGIASATIRASGTVRDPEVEIAADVAKPEAYGEQIDRLRATIHYKTNLLEIASGEAMDGAATVRFGGSYRRTGTGWKSGEVSFDAATQSLPLTRIDRVAKLQPPVNAVVTGRLRGTAQVANGELSLRAANADLSAERITIGKDAVGNLALTIDTQGANLQVLATGKVRESTIEGRGMWTLTGNNPGSATLRFSRVSLDSLRELGQVGQSVSVGPSGNPGNELPFEGFVEGRATVNVPLRSLRDVTAQIALDAVQVNPRPNQALRLGVQPQDIVLKNDRPVLADVTAQEVRLRQADFTGRDTSLHASGAIPLREGSSADLTVRGNVNLILLQLFNPDLLARGDATVDASVRGNIQNPNVNGRLGLKGASLYLKDLPNGIDDANGSILFDRNRAAIEKLTAETGGGKLSLTGLVEFRSPVLYRLQAAAEQVRVRWEDVSTTFNARLALNGTPDSSTLSGTITLVRSAFNPRTDLGVILANASKPTPAPSAPNEYLRGLQFDVRIESGSNFGFETSLTRDVEAEVDLNLHGTPLRPVLLGIISVNQGEVQLFGNRYSIDRGEVRFLNPIKIEPVLDIDLATKARGITVNVSLSGPPQQLKINYSSDPPLQSGEIIALLAVGRDPTSTNTTVGSPASTGGLAQAGSGLLGQAVNAQISSRLQRFFGSSRVKIDPTLTGVDNLPQARLTIEQQVSKDITLTYITNLNRTQEQAVRIQWDLNRNWSAIANRDPNGLFGIDFQYRKRF
jgi:translocation and assembly module TamB